MILISNEINYKDPLVKSLERYLTVRGIEYLNIADEIESERGIKFSQGSLPFIDNLNKSRFSSLFWRIPKVDDARIYDGNDFEIFNFNKFLKYYIELLSQSSNSMVKHPHSSNAENKLIQHKIAQSLGFTLPKTYIGNNKDEVLNLFGEKVLFKPLQSQGVADNSFVGPTLIKRQELLELTIVSLPGIFQNFIEKKYEVRIALWEDDYASCKISPNSGAYGFDWRIWPKEEFCVELFSPPDNLIFLCRKMLKSLNLNFGVFDFIMGKDNNLYFLEVNPAGSYLFLELYFPECKVFQKTINFLLNGNNVDENVSVDKFYVE